LRKGRVPAHVLIQEFPLPQNINTRVLWLQQGLHEVISLSTQFVTKNRVKKGPLLDWNPMTTPSGGLSFTNGGNSSTNDATEYYNIPARWNPSTSNALPPSGANSSIIAESIVSSLSSGSIKAFLAGEPEEASKDNTIDIYSKNKTAAGPNTAANSNCNKTPVALDDIIVNETIPFDRNGISAEDSRFATVSVSSSIVVPHNVFDRENNKESFDASRPNIQNPNFIDETIWPLLPTNNMTAKKMDFGGSDDCQQLYRYNHEMNNIQQHPFVQSTAIDWSLEGNSSPISLDFWDK
jgi:hypothetical protein